MEESLETKIKYKLVISFGSEIETWSQDVWEGNTIKDSELKKQYDSWNKEKWELMKQPIIYNKQIFDKTEYITDVVVYRGIKKHFNPDFVWKRVNYENYLKQKEMK